MADTTKADQLRAMREANAAAARKSSRGGVESRHAAQHGVGTAGVRIPKAKADVSGLRPIAGVAPGPRETNPEKSRKAPAATGINRVERSGGKLGTKSPPVVSVPNSLGARGPKKGQGGRPRRGKEDETIQAQKPWLAEKISERTWYRRQAEAKSK